MSSTKAHRDLLLKLLNKQDIDQVENHRVAHKSFLKSLSSPSLEQLYPHKFVNKDKLGKQAKNLIVKSILKTSSLFSEEQQQERVMAHTRSSSVKLSQT